MQSYQEQSRYDSVERRKGVRKPRDRGVWVFIPAVELRKAGIDPHAEPPTYRTVGHQRSTHGHSVIVTLYA